VKRPREEEAWRNWKRKSAFNTFLTVEVPSKGYCDLIEFLKDTRNDIHDLIVEELRVRKALKFYLTVRPQLSRIDPDGNETNSTPYLCSLPTIILESSDIHDLLDETGDRIKELLSSHEGEGSGFTLDSILDCQLNIATYDVVGGSTHTPLPKHIQSKNATVNIKNKGDKNFLFCLSYVRKPVVKDAQRASKYIKDLNNFDIFGIKFPVTMNQIEKFEQQNRDFSVNVFKLDKKKEINLVPLYTTPERQRKYHANLLQIGNTQKPHYVVISNMSRLLFDKTSDHNKMYICKYCLASFFKEFELEAHKC
jgi:hypothetical protein